MFPPAIVGAGVCGLATAVALRQEGFSPAVYERAGGIEPAGAGTVVGPNALKAFRSLGIADAVEDAGVPMEWIRVLDATGRTLTWLDLEQFERRAFEHTYVYVDRTLFRRRLRDALPADAVQFDSECVGVARQGDAVLVRFADRDPVRSSAVIGADGARSTVRGALFPDAAARPGGITAYQGIADVSLSERRRTDAWQVLGRGAHFGFGAIGPDRVWWYAAVTEPPGEADDPTDALRNRYEEFPGPVTELLDHTAAVAVSEPADVPSLPAWHRGAVALAGDAAHAPLPYLGQGVGQAVEDARVLAARLRSHDPAADAFEAYEATRKPDAERVVARSRQAARLAAVENHTACRVRNAALRVLPEWPTRFPRRAFGSLSY